MSTGTYRTPAAQLWRRLWRYVGPHKGKLVAVVLLNAAAAFADVFSFTLLIPFLNALFKSDQLLPATGTIGQVLQATIGFLLDEQHGDFIRTHFHVNPHDMEQHDIVLNTGRLSIHECAEVIRGALDVRGAFAKR